MTDTSLTPEKIFNILHQFGMENENKVLVEKYSRYFKEGYDAYGLSQGMLETKTNEILDMPGISFPLICDASLLLVASPRYEMPAAAFRLLLAYKKQWDKNVVSLMERWFSIGISNWAHTDYLCGEIMPLLFQKNLVSIESLIHWRKAENRFQRRAAVVSLIKPMKKGLDFSAIFHFIESMMHDPERVVHQALGWLLREMWKKDPEPVEEFLLKYKDAAPRLIFQYATEKMTPESKSKFRKQK